MKNNEFDEFDMLNNDDKLSFPHEDDVDLDDLISLMVAIIWLKSTNNK